MNHIQNHISKVSTTINHSEYLIETGRMANQAHGSVWIQQGDTVVLVTAVSQPLERDIDFMPLVVDYQEMSYASGRIPGSYFRREIGRPSERETLVSRLIDRPLRPLFPAGFQQEVQIIATVLSADPEHDPDILAITGASASLHISHIPFSGPIAGARIACVDNSFILNPKYSELEVSEIDLVIAASQESVVMVEGQAHSASEDLIAEAISWGHEQIKPFLELQNELQEKSGQPKIEVPELETDEEIKSRIRQLACEPLSQALSTTDKIERQKAKKAVKESVHPALEQEFADDPERLKALSSYIKELESEIVRTNIQKQGKRIDGRDLTSIRSLSTEVGLLPRVHGSSLFTRGETKALGVVTLGSSHDEQHIETLTGEENKRFMVHYNFPPYCVGEVKMLRGPARREIGHGALAERSLKPILPTPEEFPFTIRIVSEIMESNGSSSMATVCAGSMALMDAGVPIKAPVGGIAMGLIKEGDDYFILTDILGDEDHHGDMDFKVAGTKEGITSIQMDIKISGIPSDILRKALYQAQDARLEILDHMKGILEQPRNNLSEHAPQLQTIEIDPERIKDIIGPGGKTIKAITKATGASIDIEDGGKINIFAPNSTSLQETMDKVLFYDQRPEIGKNYLGKVKNIKDFGAFVEILPNVDGMIHISQLDINRVNNIYEAVQVGDEMWVKVIDIEKDGGRIRLSRKAVLMEEKGENYTPPPQNPKQKDSSRSNSQKTHSNKR